MMMIMILSILFNVCYNENTLSSFSNRFELARSVHWELFNDSLPTLQTLQDEDIQRNGKVWESHI